ncbi:MAG TPA: hypothetical protein PKJ83_16395, partial [Cyclobacteriaceae bacterium]|nr:hypothetical protein [Cyclobacteriaceae bacterium]
ILYNLLQPLQGTSVAAETATGIIPAPGAPAGIGSVTDAMVWNDLLFNNYDYDSVTRRGSGLSGTDDQSRNIFDS